MSHGEVLQELANLRSSLDSAIDSVASGSRSIGEVFAAASTNSSLGYLYAVKAMEADPRVGKVRARRILEELGLGETTRISELSADQVAKIVAEVA